MIEPQPKPGAGTGARSMVGNAGVLFTGRVVVALLGWLGTLLIIRKLSVEEWGRFAFVFYFLSLLVILTNIVNARQAIRGYLEAEDQGSFAGAYVLLRAALGLIGYPAALLFVVLAHYPSEVVAATAVAGTVIVIATPSIGFDAMFQASMRVGPIAVANVLGQGAQLALTIVLVLRHSSMVQLTVPAVLCEVVAVAWKLRSVRLLVRIRYRVSLRIWARLLRSGIPFAIGSALATIYYSLDMVMLSKMDTFESVGAYGIAYKFAGVVQFVPVALSASIIAVMVRHWPERPTAFWAAFTKAMLASMVVAVPLVAGSLLFTGPAIRALYGADYVNATHATQLVLASECVGFFTSLAVTTLVSMERNILYPVAALIGLTLNLSLNLLVIPRWSFNGAAWDTLITEVAVASVLWVAVLRTPGRPALPFASLAWVVGAGVVAAVAAYGAHQLAPWPAASAVLIVVYGLILHFGRVPGPQGLRSFLVDTAEVDAAS